jgi:hypothetical protein
VPALAHLRPLNATPAAGPCRLDVTQQLQQVDLIATCVTLDLLLQQLDETLNIRPKQLKHLQNT